VIQVTIPFIAHVISYVEKELDEMEREEFTRVKMLKSKKEAQLKGKLQVRVFLVRVVSSQSCGQTKNHLTPNPSHALSFVALGEVESNSSADPDNMLANFDTARDPDVVF
jgi:hypothetical protein